jgi:hypothetical protein
MQGDAFIFRWGICLLLPRKTRIQPEKQLLRAPFKFSTARCFLCRRPHDAFSNGWFCVNVGNLLVSSSSNHLKWFWTLKTFYSEHHKDSPVSPHCRGLKCSFLFLSNIPLLLSNCPVRDLILIYLDTIRKCLQSLLSQGTWRHNHSAMFHNIVVLL